ncbi:MAG: hypothetical protein IIT68_01165 [Treponema sp.]|nr:hypothetical protein [Treponema sp.]
MKRLAFAFILVLSLALTACQTTEEQPEVPAAPAKPALKEVHPLSLLADDFSIYVGVPVKYHQQLVADIICAEIPNLSKKDALTVVKQINVLYAGLGTVADRSLLEIAAGGTIPSLAQSAIFTQNNGWISQVYRAQSTPEALKKGYPNEFKYYRRRDTRFQVGIPSQKIITVARDLAPLFENYAVREEPLETNYNEWVDLTRNAGQDIRFYITKPGQYLRNLLGSDILGSNEVFGYLTYKPDASNPSAYSGNYVLTFDLRCNTSRTAKTLFAALQLSLGLMGGNISMRDDTTLEVSGLEITEKKLIDLFTRDPITGKHFEVNADGTVTTTNR